MLLKVVFSSAFWRNASVINLGAKSFYRGLSTSSGSSENISAIIRDKCENIVVMAGAGLSTPSGIPDFRSPKTGLYHNLQKYNLPYPEAIFDVQYFMDNPMPFITLAQELYPGVKYRPNLGHYFVRLLHEKGKLLRMYTQNIDGLERLSGIPGDKLIEAHGSFSTASCIVCGDKHDPEAVKKTILSGNVYECVCKGYVKPDIVFFGEQLPGKFWLYNLDIIAADLLIVLGTSLEVQPFASICDAVPYKTPRILINREVVGSLGLRDLDHVLVGDIIQNVSDLAKEIGWEDDLIKLQKENENS
ncbi:NAD-dependent protein deacetylase sirtuin-3, mitochondrial-like [Ischnura elegans]|uniref:NAD-dependent protein deacetylase sirtuin-3, mitochondrial-like n=1 Tax=Ischnura elegans TaxID=197161 RepID=UPI001ED8AD92|nr:NAD-dependent protein deacetylase sirtuin-3, mitochondrial-like [Ischnura elegans]